MNCADLEMLLCDYVDGTLRGQQKSAVEEHLAGCAACSLAVQDAGAALALVERSALVEPPPELMTRMVFDLAAERDRHRKLAPSFVRRLFARVLEPVLQPRAAMGMAMTVLSFAMLFQFAGIEPRHLRPSDLDPVKVWAALEDRSVRTWERGVKYYENVRLVYEIETRLKEWSDQADEEASAGTGRTQAGPDADQAGKKAP
ncbi:MAG: zf-HC2 domain-containing protein [Bryobacteraceae bacterium]